MNKSNIRLCVNVFAIFMFYGLILLSGCTNRSKEQNGSENSSELESERFWINQYVPTEGKQTFTIENTESGVYRFCSYTDKQIIKERIIEDTYEGFYYDTEREVLYSYNREKKQLEILNTEFEPIDVLISDLQLFEIKNMVGIGAEIYALIVPENPYEAEVTNYDTGEAGYLDFKERLYAINPKSGEMKRIEVENPICLTRGEEEILVYAYQQGEYRLVSYDTVNDKFSVVKGMKDLGYLFAMAYRDNCLYFTGCQYPGLWKCDLTTGETSCLNKEAVIVKDADLFIKEKSLFMLDHLGGEIYRY